MDTLKEPSKVTINANESLIKNLPSLKREKDSENVKKGFIGTSQQKKILDSNGKLIWDLEQYSFTEGDRPAPFTCNPSLWSQAKLLACHGLFKVTDQIHQVRGFDISNITFIIGKSGLIVVDPLISAECAKAALDLYYQHLGQRQVKAVIYTHSHLDHYGGVYGVTTKEAVDKGEVRIIAPVKFMEAAISENLLAGSAMRRRASYMFGIALPRNEKGSIIQAASSGSAALIPPTELVTKSPETIEIDGIKFIFQLTPDTEAPAELNFYLPDLKVLCIAEICSNMQHNLYTLRGAQVRDAKAWSFYINEALELFGERSEVLFLSHHWPRWGTEEIMSFLRKQRDMYAYIHDQTLRMVNQGYTPIDIAEELRLPPTLASEWHTRDFYGTVNHNAKAVYQRYMGWFDGNPANLHPLPPVEAGKKYVEFMGGAEALLARAKACFEKGEYRWVAQVVNHLVFADPQNQAARALQADVLEQLGYQAESGLWRNFYLSGAHELRNILPDPEFKLSHLLSHALALPLPDLFDQFAIRVNGVRAGAQEFDFNLHLKDINQDYHLHLENAVLHHGPVKPGKKVNASVRISRVDLLALMREPEALDGMVEEGDAEVEGSKKSFGQFLGIFDRFDPSFNIALPKKDANK